MKKFLSILLVLAMVLSFGIPAFAEDGDSGNSNNSADVQGNYTPSLVSDAPEAKWGKSADELSTSGTFAEALVAATQNDEIKYIQLQNNVTATARYDIDTSSVLTLDLNGKMISTSATFPENADLISIIGGTVTIKGGTIISNGYAIPLDVHESNVIIESGTYQCTDAQVCYVGENSTVTINGGTFLRDRGAGEVISIVGGTLTINGGSFQAKDSDGFALSVSSGTAIVKDGTFHNILTYVSGELELSACKTSTLLNLKVCNLNDDSVSVTKDTIQLPAGFGFYDTDDGEKTIVTSLENWGVYAIRSTADPCAVTVGNVTNGTITADKTKAVVGEEVILTVTPATDYALDTLTVKNDSTQEEITVTATPTAGKYKFTMPQNAVTVTATFKKLAKITGISVKVGASEPVTDGMISLEANSGDVVLTFSGTDFANMSEALCFGFKQNESVAQSGAVNALDGTLDTSANTLTLTKQSSYFSFATTAVELVYSNNGGVDWSDTGIYVIYQSDITSVDIEWGTLAFVYSDEQDANGEEKGWSCEDGANQIKITNKGTVAIIPTVTYTQKAGYECISGTVSVLNLENNMNSLTNGVSKTYVLTLAGKPTTALDGAEIGYVTVTIKKNEGQ